MENTTPETLDPDTWHLVTCPGCGDTELADRPLIYCDFCNLPMACSCCPSS